MCFWCEIVLSWIWEEIWSPVRRWATSLITRCNRQACNWWCLCCNKWFCWLFAIIVAIIVFIVSLILIVTTVVVCAACYIACTIACILFWVFTRTPVRNCVDACHTGRLQPWESEPTVDPQEPLAPDDLRKPGGGVSG